MLIQYAYEVTTQTGVLSLQVLLYIYITKVDMLIQYAYEVTKPSCYADNPTLHPGVIRL